MPTSATELNIQKFEDAVEQLTGAVPDRCAGCNSATLIPYAEALLVARHNKPLEAAQADVKKAFEHCPGAVVVGKETAMFGDNRKALCQATGRLCASGASLPGTPCFG